MLLGGSSVEIFDPAVFEFLAAGLALPVAERLDDLARVSTCLGTDGTCSEPESPKVFSLSDFVRIECPLAGGGTWPFDKDKGEIWLAFKFKSLYSWLLCV